MVDLYEQEEQVKWVRDALECWHVSALKIRAMLAWQHPWQPVLLVAAATLLHVFLWLLDSNVLVPIVLANFVDILVMSKTVQPRHDWSEWELQELCTELVLLYNSAAGYVITFFSMRKTRPTMYYLCSSWSLILLALLVTLVNASVASLVATCALLLAPGLLDRDYHRRHHRQRRPKKYYLCSSWSLILLALLVTLVNASVASLVATCALLLAPGLLDRDYHRRHHRQRRPKKVE